MNIANASAIKIKTIAITVTGREAANVGPVVDGALSSSDDNSYFVGSISNSGKGSIAGYFYMAGGSKYWSAVVTFFGRKPIHFQGLAGVYTSYE